MTLPAPYYADASVTLYHGDALDLLPLLAPGSVDVVATDPPYSSGGAFRGDRTASVVAKYTQSGTRAHRPEFSGDTRDQRGYAAWCALWLNAARHATVSGGIVACFIDWRQLPTMTDAVQAGGWVWRGIAPWTKGFGRPNGPGRFTNAAEYVVWGSNGPIREHDAYPQGSCDVPEIGGAFECRPPREREHVAQKPVEVMRWVLGVAPPGGCVLDPFAGSGTTLLAARSLGLTAIGIEVDEHSCEVAASRLSRLPVERSDGQRVLFRDDDAA